MSLHLESTDSKILRFAVLLSSSAWRGWLVLSYWIVLHDVYDTYHHLSSLEAWTHAPMQIEVLLSVPDYRTPARIYCVYLAVILNLLWRFKEWR